MLAKELENYLLSECANCACPLNKEDRVPEPTVIIPRSNLSEKSEYNFNINAVSYIYKIPPEELIANVRSHTIKQSDESSKEFDELTTDECLQMNLAFCKTCTPMFVEVYRSHKILRLWSSVGNLISKAIQPDNRYKKHNPIEDTTNNSEIIFKSENDDNEIGSIEETENWDNHNFVYVNPENQCYENICEEPLFDPLYEEMKCEDQIDLENHRDDSNSSSEIAGNKTSKECEDTSIFDTHQTVCIKLEESEEQKSSGQLENILLGEITNDINNLFIEGPPFHCPLCTKMPPFKYPNGLRLHCKVDHQFIIPDSAFSEEALKESDIQFKTHPIAIRGPPYQCPSCVESFKVRNPFVSHCKTVHQLLIPGVYKKSISFPCCFCKKEFRQTSCWQNHCRIDHNCRFVCLLCKFGFGTNDDLQTHFKTECGTNGSLREASLSNSPSVTETEKHSIADVTQDEDHITDKIVAKNAHPGNTKSSSNASDVSIGVEDKFLLFPKNKSNTPPFVCPKFDCNQRFPYLALLQDHCTEIHKLILKIVNVKRRTHFCDECSELSCGQKEFKEHLKAAHYEKFAICQRPSEGSNDPDCEKSLLKCGECGLTFEQYNLLQQHSVEIHSLTLASYEQRFFNFICRGCDTLYETAHGLSVHTRQCFKKNNKGAKKVFSCKYCSMTFNSIHQLKTHMKYVHHTNMPKLFFKNDPKTPRCVFCLKVFNSPRDLYYHRLIIRGNSFNSTDNDEMSSVTCRICKARFITRGGMKRHQSLMHPAEVSYSIQGPFDCDVCSKSFPKKYTLNNHIRSTHMKLKKTCKVCGEKILKGSFNRHIRVAHTGYKPYKCRFCDKTYIDHTGRKYHEVTIHSDVCPFMCSICGKGFKLRMKMKYHEKTHSTEKGYVCERCGAALKSKFTFNLHMRNHKQDDLAGPNPKCSECNKAFSNGNQLRYHKRISHNKHGPLPCPICGKTFPLQHQVTYHMRAMHPESV